MILRFLSSALQVAAGSCVNQSLACNIFTGRLIQIECNCSLLIIWRSISNDASGWKAGYGRRLYTAFAFSSRTHYFVTRFIDPCKREIVDVLNSGNNFPVDCHIRERGIVNSLLSIPIHCEDRCVTSKPVATTEDEQSVIRIFPSLNRWNILNISVTSLTGGRVLKFRRAKIHI